jgi:acyl carrier protein
MGNSQAEIEQTIRTFLDRANKLPAAADELTPQTSLYADGLGLDSLETAELSATLEDEHGTDPFSSGPMPQTVGDILAFYAGAGASS